MLLSIALLLLGQAQSFSPAFTNKRVESALQVSRREAAFGLVASVAVGTGLLDPQVARAAEAEVAEEGSKLIEFEVTNLDGEEGKTGTFVVRTHPNWAPIGVGRFEELTEKGFWADCRFFRVLPGFVSQFGVNGNPDTMSYWRSKNLRDDPVKVSNKRGTVVFATAGPNSRTTQIFINTGERNSFLDKSGFSPFGEVVSGMDVVDRFYSGYGEGAPQGKGPNQGLIQNKGNAYLSAQYPKLSYITKASFK